MAAIATVFFAYLEAGAHLVGTDSVYGPSRVIVEKHFRRFGVQSSFVDTSDLKNIRTAIRPETRLLYIETPENPTIRLTDLEGCAEIAREHGLLLVVDNTFATPILQRPLEYGADIVTLEGNVKEVVPYLVQRAIESVTGIDTEQEAINWIKKRIT